MNLWNTQNPFTQNSMTYDRQYNLYSEGNDRSSDRSTVNSRVLLGQFQGCEPQQVKRITTNLLIIGQDEAMQLAAYHIFTPISGPTVTKGNVIVDQATNKTYRVITTYPQGDDLNITVTNIDD